VSTDTTVDITMPIYPLDFVKWYYNNASGIIASLNPLLSQSSVNQICGSNFECVHDYLIRINSFTSGSTASELQVVQQSKNILGKI
jgi:hypothetical protein